MAGGRDVLGLHGERVIVSDDADEHNHHQDNDQDRSPRLSVQGTSHGTSGVSGGG